MYEKDIKLEMQLVNLMDDVERATYRDFYPMGKVPLLVKENDYFIPESSIIIEYLDTHYNKGPTLIPENKEDSRKVRFFDRMYDLYLNDSVSTLILQSMKKPENRIQELMEKAEFRIKTLYTMMQDHFGKSKFAYGDSFTMADCAVIPPLYYAQYVMPFNDYDNIKRYFSEIKLRPSVQRLLAEVEPLFQEMRNAG